MANIAKSRLSFVARCTSSAPRLALWASTWQRHAAWLCMMSFGTLCTMPRWVSFNSMQGSGSLLARHATPASSATQCYQFIPGMISHWHSVLTLMYAQALQVSGNESTWSFAIHVCFHTPLCSLSVVWHDATTWHTHMCSMPTGKARVMLFIPLLHAGLCLCVPLLCWISQLHWSS